MSTRYVRTKSVVMRRVAGETVLVPVRRGSVDQGPDGLRTVFYLLNDTGELLWDELASPQLEEDLARRLITEYEISMQQAQADVAVFLRDLREAHALDVVQES